MLSAYKSVIKNNRLYLCPKFKVGERVRVLDTQHGWQGRVGTVVEYTPIAKGPAYQVTFTETPQYRTIYMWNEIEKHNDI